MFAVRAAVLAVVGVVALSATGVRIGNHAAFVRVVVDFNGRVPANQVEFDGLWTRTAALHVARPGITTSTSGGTGQGVRVGLQPATQKLNIGLSFAARRFKYVSYAVVGGNRLAIDLWKSAPPTKAAEIRTGFSSGKRCLALDRWHARGGKVTVTGSAGNLYEHAFSVIVRGARGKALGVRAGSASGRWNASIRYHATHRQAGTLEAVSFSGKDGSITCIAQVRLTLPAT